MPDEITMRIVKVGDHAHLGGPGPLAGLGVTILSIDEEWVAVDAGQYGEIGCPIDDLVIHEDGPCPTQTDRNEP